VNTATHKKQGDTIYTAVSFAPVQGFIEKSRKLRDLFGASLILSYLSQQLLEEATRVSEVKCIISPGFPENQKGMPNKILLEGDWSRDDVEQALLKAWKGLLEQCRIDIETQFAPPPTQYDWQAEWDCWGRYTWEVSWGKGNSPERAMDNLETRKLRRAWTAINWVGESSSLTGTDAIAWPQMGSLEKDPGRSLTKAQQDAQDLFYGHLSWLFDDPDNRMGEPRPSKEELKAIAEKKEDNTGKFIAANERLSIPELVKRLITYDNLSSDAIKIAKLKENPQDPEFKDIHREAGYWSGWFMGDGDGVGENLRKIAQKDAPQRLKLFSEKMRGWGKTFQEDQAQIPNGRGRVIYAGGDDFLGVIYSEETKKKAPPPEKIMPIDALEWLIALPDQWKGLQNDLQQTFDVKQTYSVGFVWAGHQVPQRDILQHCREAEQRSKALDKNRVTIRIVFNSGQYVQWTCPWDYLDFLHAYKDRNNKTWEQSPNWVHLYQDWAHLKARHAIQLKESVETADDRIALHLFDLYFGQRDRLLDNAKWIVGDDSPAAILQWLDGLVNVGWQLCSNT
jgi:CRISPR-associated protein Cmr2